MARDLPATRTNRFALPPSTEYLRRGGVEIARTPSRPDYSYGHRFVLPGHPFGEPGSDAFQRWNSKWDRTHIGNRAARRRYFSWESRDLDPVRRDRYRELAAQHGARLYCQECLCLEAVVLPSRASPDCVPRPLALDELPRAASVSDAATGGKKTDFLRWLYAEYGVRVARGEGETWGAFLDEKLVGVASLFVGGREARFQDVVVLPEAQGRGVASSLLHAMLTASDGLAAGREIYIVAEAGGRAHRLYSALGFFPVSTVYDVSTERFAER